MSRALQIGKEAMAGEFEEPEVLATFDRSFGDKREQLRLERGAYRGTATFALRVCWQSPTDRVWRWAQAKPNQSGRCWQALSLKARELRALGAALIAAADALDGTGGGQRERSAPSQDSPRAPANGSPGQRRGPGEDDDIPF